MESTLNQTYIGRTANPEAAWHHGELANLAKLVDKSTLHHKKLSTLVSKKVGTESVESKAARWGLAEMNAELESFTMQGDKATVNGLQGAAVQFSARGRNGGLGLWTGIGARW